MLKPIDMPHDDLDLFRGFDEAIRTALAERVRQAHAAGRWRSPADILWNPGDPEFMAYYAQKCMDPITVPMAGAGLEEHFAPFRRTRFDLAPAGFVAAEHRRLSAVGDLMPTAHLEDSQDRLYASVADLVFGADCAFANLECTIAPGGLQDFGDFAPGGTPILNVTRAEYLALTRHGRRRFDVLQLANNHVLDGGAAGVVATLAALRADGIAPLGVHDSTADAARPRRTRIGGLTVGWIAHTYCTNGKPPPADQPWLVDVTPFHVERAPDLAPLLRQIGAARHAGCDLVLVCLHWGPEWEFYPLPVQRDWARAIAEAGADAIIGTHPHVIQPVEIFRPASAPWKSVPILYSLGNLTPTMGAACTTLSLVATLTLARGGPGSTQPAAITELELTPVALMREDADGTDRAVCVPLRLADGAGTDSGTRAHLDEMCGYADMVIGPDWRTPRGPGGGQAGDLAASRETT